MKKENQIEKLLGALGRDRQLRRILADLKRASRKKKSNQTETMTGFFLLSLAIIAKFASKKKTRALEELLEVVYLLVQLSFLVKENIFDRPEVKKFIGQHSQEIYIATRKYVEMVLPKIHSMRVQKFKRA